MRLRACSPIDVTVEFDSLETRLGRPKRTEFADARSERGLEGVVERATDAECVPAHVRDLHDLRHQVTRTIVAAPRAGAILARPGCRDRRVALVLGHDDP